MTIKRKGIPKERQTISLEKKIEILDKLKFGQGSASVAKEYERNEATVRTINRMEDSIRKSVASTATVSALKALKFQRTIKNALSQYEEIYKNTRQSKITDFIPSKSNSTIIHMINKVENMANTSISEAVPMRNVDEFSVSDSDSDVTPVQPKKKRILACQNYEEE